MKYGRKVDAPPVTHRIFPGRGNGLINEVCRDLLQSMKAGETVMISNDELPSGSLSYLAAQLGRYGPFKGKAVGTKGEITACYITRIDDTDMPAEGSPCYAREYASWPALQMADLRVYACRYDEKAEFFCRDEDIERVLGSATLLRLKKTAVRGRLGYHPDSVERLASEVSR